MSIEASMVGYYAGRAAEYERIYQKPERQADLLQLRELVATTFADKVVLEVACGTGYWTEVIASSARSIVATDINEEVITIARSKSIDASKVTFQKADAYELPREWGPFDAGLSVFWWSHVTKANLKDFLHGFHRTLKPGARVMFIDNRYVEGSSTPVSRTDEWGNSYQLRRLDDGNTHEVLKNFPDERELRRSVEGCATGVEVTLLQYYWVLSYLLP